MRSVASMVITVATLVATIAELAASSNDSVTAFSEFQKRDREAFERFRTGTSTEDRKTGRNPPPMRSISPERLRAEEIYNKYRMRRDRLENPDPEKGLNAKIAVLRAKLFRTNRPWADSVLWGDQEWKIDWPLLQDLEARAVPIREELQKLEAAWRDEGFAARIGRDLNDGYGRTIWYVYLDKEDHSVFPSPIRSNLVDYVTFEINSVWPTNIPPATATPSSSTSSETEQVIHDAPPPPAVPAPETPEIDEEIQTENIGFVKPWDQMTPEERRRALMENRPEAWSGFCRDVFGTDTNGQALVTSIVACSNVTDGATNIAIANLPPPTPMTTGKAWDAMTAEERHKALRANEPLAWDGLRDALISGDAERIKQVIEALTPKPQINDAARAVAYWHGYQTAQMESATSPGNSNLDVIAAAYVHPELMALVRQGYADAQAGRPPQYAVPTPPDAYQF